MKAKPIVVMIILSILSIAWFNPKADKIKTGNRLYNAGKYDQAMDRYTDVLVELPNSPDVQYNVGASAYKQGDYERAVEAYSKSLTADYPALEEKGNYSIGNCKYKLGERMENNNLTGAIAHYREALESYKRAIDLNSKNMDAKFNYEVVQRKIKELEDRLQQQNQQQNQDTDQQNQENQEERKEKSQKDEPQDADSQEDQQQNRENQQETLEQEDAQQNTPAQASEAKEEMTKTEALKLLDALKDEEQQQLIRRRRRGTSYPENFKDW